MKKSLLFVLITVPLFSFAQLMPKSIVSANGTIGFYEFKPPGYNADSTYEYPLIIFLHGVGERGNGTNELPMALLASFPKLLVRGATMQFTVNGRKHAFLVLLPQMSKKYMNWQSFYIDEMIGYAKKNLKIDKNKIFLTGWSLGGGGAWKYPTSSIYRANLLAGIVPVSPSPNYTDLCNISQARVAVWAHHARDDRSVPVHFSKDAIQGIKVCHPLIPPLITYYTSGGHPFVANQAYDTLNKTHYPNIYQWMIGTSRSNNPATNLQPVPLAGNDTVIILPSVKTILNGQASFDPNDVITRYEWVLAEGPVSPRLHFKKPDFPVSEVSGLEPGNYIFRLKVTDQFGVTRSDDIKVHVKLPPYGINASPFVDAGPPMKVNTNECEVYIKARDFDGSIQQYRWRQISGPAKLIIRNYGNVADILELKTPGKYLIEISASDNGKPSGSGKDTLTIIRTPVLPFNGFLWSDNRNNFLPFKRNTTFPVSNLYMLSGVLCTPVLIYLMLLGFLLFTAFQYISGTRVITCSCK